MKNFKMLKERTGAHSISRDNSPYIDSINQTSKPNQLRYDQGPQPNYPNFEPKK